MRETLLMQNNSTRQIQSQFEVGLTEYVYFVMVPTTEILQICQDLAPSEEKLKHE